MNNLTAAQQDLLDAIKRGVRVHYLAGFNSHYFRTDDKRNPIHATVQAIEATGLVERVNEDWRGYTLRWKKERP